MMWGEKREPNETEREIERLVRDANSVGHLERELLLTRLALTHAAGGRLVVKADFASEITKLELFHHIDPQTGDVTCETRPKEGP